MPLSDLPAEILLLIADCLDNVATNTLAYTNSQLYHLLNRLLYRRDIVKLRSKSLTWATRNGVEGTVQHAINAGQHFTQIPRSFNIALQIAADRGHVRLVELLLQVDGIKPNFRRGPLEAAPLSLATKKGHSAIVELLLAADEVDPNVRDQSSWTPLHWACLLGHVSIVRQLLAENDIDLNAILYTTCTTPLTLTVTCYANHAGDAHMEIIDLLLAQDSVDVNFQGRDTALMKATKSGLVEVVRSLLTRVDLDPNIVDSDGNHVLGTAAARGDIDIAKLLLGHPDIDPNFMAGGGRTALMEATRPDMVKLLLDQKGIEVNGQDNLGWTALCLAACYSNIGIAKLLLEREDIDVNLPANGGLTPLCWACHNDCIILVDLLLQKDNIDPNPRDTARGRTPLAHVCHYSCCSVAVVRSLLSHPGTDSNAVDSNGFSILADLIDRRRRSSANSNGVINDSNSERDDEIEALLRAASATRGVL